MRFTKLTNLKYLPLFLTVLALQWGLYSCGQKGKQVVAVIDGQNIAGDYFRSTQNERFPDKPRTEQNTALKQFYQILVRAHAARGMGLDEKDSLYFDIRATQKNIMIRALYRSFVVEHVVTPAMVKEAYSHMDERRQVRHILLQHEGASRSRNNRSESEAESLSVALRKQITKGNLSFENAAKEFSDDQSTSQKGGALGGLSWGQMVDAFQQTAWSLPLNRISEPVHTDFGYHLIEVTGIDTVKLRPFAKERTRIRRTLERSKQKEINQRAEEALSQITEQTGYSLNDSVVTNIAKQLTAEWHAAASENPGVWLSELLEQIDYTPIGTLRDKPISKKQFGKFLNTIQYSRFSGFQNPSETKKMLEFYLRQEALYAFAKEKRIDRFEDTEYQLQWPADKTLSSYYLDNLVLSDFPPPEDTLRAFFNRVREERYTEPGEVHVKEIYLNDEATANKVRQLLDDNTPFFDLAKEYTQRPTFKEKGGDLGWFTTDRYGPIGEKAKRMKPGELSGPFAVGTGWAIIKLVEKLPGEGKPFDEIRNTVKQDYTNRYKPKRIEQNIQQLEEKYNCELYYSFLDNK